MRYCDLYVEILIEAFGDDQKKKWLSSNPTLTSDQIDIYIKWFDQLRKSKPAAAKDINIANIPTGDDRFDISKYKDWRGFESFVDAVRGQTQLSGEKLSDNLDVEGAEPLFKENGLEVYYADTPRACIKYKGNVPYGWCVSKPDSSNMFYSYRLGDNNPAFYFVKDVDATQTELSSNEKFTGKFKNKWHFFVIQVLTDVRINNINDENYVVTSANNDGDVPMSWKQIVKIQPKLQNLQSKFLPKPLSDDELDVIDKYRDGITTQEFIELSYNEKETFLDVYASADKPISDGIFEMMPYDLKNKYIGMSIGLSDKQYKSIQSDPNLLKRYIQLVKRKFEIWLKDSDSKKFANSELDVLDKYNIWDTYIDKLTSDNIENLLSYSTDPQKTIDVLLNKNVQLTSDNANILLVYSDDPQKTVDVLLNKNVPLTDAYVSNLLTFSTDKQTTIDFLLNKGLSIDKILTFRYVNNLLLYSTDKQTTINLLFNNNVPLTDPNVIRLLLNYSPSKEKTRKKIDALKLKQQLREIKFKYRDFFIESMTDSYRYSANFETESIDYEDEDTGEVYKKDVLQPVQIVRFTGGDGTPYIWYVKRDRYDDTLWTIAFGIFTGIDVRGSNKLDINLSNKGDAFRVLSTVINITNDFIQFDDDYNEVQRLMFTSEGDKRTALYLKRVVPRIENFKVDNVSSSGSETTVTLSRTY